jgi:cytoskeletal protein RodZ
MESVGARLKKIRLEKGLSLEEVHKRTKIHLNVLKAIEEDSLVNLSPVYLRGFLKLYCRFLGLEPAEFIPEYRKPAYTFRKGALYTEEKPVRQTSFFRSASLRLGRLHYLEAAKLKRAVVLGLIVAAGFFILTKTGKFIARLPKKTAVGLPKLALPPKEVTPLPEKIVIPALLKVELQAKEDCWVSLKADGKVVQHGKIKKGRSESWQAKEKMELSAADAGLIVLQVNGKPFPNLGKKGRPLKNFIITKEGLTLKK